MADTRQELDPDASPRLRVGLPVIGTIMLVMLVAGTLAVYKIAQPAQPTHVVLIVLDTVRADHLTPYGYAHDTTPRLQRFAAAGLLFEEARATAPWTLPSHASLFTGRLPHGHGCDWEHRYLVDAHETAAETLSGLGYECYGVTTNVNASSLYNLHQGFDHFRETWKLRGEHPGRDDSVIANREVGSWLSERDRRRPFFLFVNFSDAHLPYQPPPETERLFGNPSDRARRLAAQPDLLQKVASGAVRIDAELARDLAALYDAELRRLDDRVGELLDLLEAEGALENSLVIITSDHGELLGEGGAVDHQLSMREELLRVPLMVNFPGRVNPYRIATPTPLTRVYRWLLQAAEGRIPEWEPGPGHPDLFEGCVSEYARPVDLLERIELLGGDAEPHDRRRFAMRSLDPGPAFKLEGAEPGGLELFVLDPSGQGVDRAGDFPGAAAALFDRYRALREVGRFQEDVSLLRPERAAESPDLEQLRRLGYVQSSAPEIPLHAVEHWSAGIRQREAGDLRDAAEQLQMAVRLAPQATPILLDLAGLLDRMGDERALEAYDLYLRSSRERAETQSDAYRAALRRREELASAAKEGS